VPHIFALQVLDGKRSLLEQKLKEHDIQYGIQYAPNHHLTLFHEDVDLPVTDEVYSRIISLPMHPEVSEDDIQLICKIINSL
jgi:dTDP-4-amino-4,6-dideoxygalactose transaminase